jgi:hypothetical protein
VVAQQADAAVVTATKITGGRVVKLRADPAKKTESVRVRFSVIWCDSIKMVDPPGGEYEHELGWLGCAEQGRWAAWGNFGPGEVELFCFFCSFPFPISSFQT